MPKKHPIKEFNGKQRPLRTPTDYATSALEPVREFVHIFSAKFANGAINADYFVKKLLDESLRIIKNSSDAQPILEYLLTIEDLLDTKDKDAVEMLRFLGLIFAYAAEAINAHESNRTEEAWSFAADAQYWSGAIVQCLGTKINKKSAASLLADIRHRENRDLIDDAKKYWHENIDKKLSAEKAATILVNVVRLSHKKLASVVSAEKKKIKSQKA